MMPQPINFADQVDNALEDRGDRDAGSHTEIDTDTFRASSMGYCPRQIVMKKLGVERPGPRGQGRFWLGDQIHDWIQQTILPRYETTHEVRVMHRTPDGIVFKGHYDAFDGQVVYDFKTRSSWYRFEPPYKHHIDQLHVYMKALGVRRGLMVYVCKKDMGVETYPDYFAQDTHRGGRNDDPDPGELTKDEHGELVRFDPDRFDELVYKARRVRDALKQDGIPRSMEELNTMFRPCGEDHCMGCKFEDPEEIDFDRIPDDAHIETEETEDAGGEVIHG